MMQHIRDWLAGKPQVTLEMKQRGTTWRKLGGEWREVCDFCGGNCGQCGMTSRIGNIPFDMQRMVDKLNESR